MTRSQQLTFLIKELAPAAAVPASDMEKWELFRALVNIRPAGRVGAEFLAVQDALLQGELAAKGITDIDALTSVRENLYLWQGDITTLRVDAVVNAANSALTGCYIPNHRCIDNAIHTFAGVQLRNECAEIMARQGYPEPTGRAKITAAYNLPSKHILHTVGPVVDGQLTGEHEEKLKSCYRSCLELAQQSALRSVAFCCISTGEFHFPNRRAAEIAVETVTAFQKEGANIKVIFNVFKNADFDIYAKLF